MYLVGQQDVNLDNKGRIVIPAKFRKLIPQFGGTELYMTYYQKDFLLLYTRQAWNEVIEQLKNIATGDDNDRTNFKEFLLYQTEIVTPDASGRILILPNFREEAGLSEGCSLVIAGQGDRLRIYTKEKFAEKSKKVLDMSAEQLREITQGINL